MCEQAVVRTPAVQNKSLIPTGKPSSGPPSPFPSRSSEARAIVRACSGVSNTKAFSARAFSMAARCASASSSAENSLLRSASRACASESAVSSFIRLWDRRRKTDCSPPALANLHRPWRSPLAPACPTRTAPAKTEPGKPKTARRPPPDRQASTSPGCRDKRARWRPVRRRGTSFHHFWHDEEVIIVRRRVGDDVIGNTAVVDHIFPHLHRHRRHRGHRLHPLDIAHAEFLDEGQDGVKLAAKILLLVLGDRDPRQMRNTADGIGIDGHLQLASRLA